MEKLEAVLAATKDLSPETLATRARGAAGRAAQAVTSKDGRILVEGRGDTGAAVDAIDALAAAVANAGVRRVAVSRNGWTVELFPIEEPPVAAPVRTPPAPVVTPTPAAHESRRSALLRAKIDHLEHELALLDRLAADADALEARRAAAEARVHSLERADRLLNADPVLQTLLSSGLFVQTDVTFTVDGILAKGLAAKNAPVDVVAAAFENLGYVVTTSTAPDGTLTLSIARTSAG